MRASSPSPLPTSQPGQRSAGRAPGAVRLRRAFECPENLNATNSISDVPGTLHARRSPHCTTTVIASDTMPGPNSFTPLTRT